jgi:predicted transcriptional regulator
MEKTTLYLPLELRRALKEQARRSGRAQAEIVREALETYLAGSWPQPTSIGVGSDEEVSARTSENWLKREWDPTGHV